ncbi:MULTISPECIES: UDP-glucose 6-dehydrogenase AglM [Haloferax]|uniref:UDP-glucose 6-dehydrogenase n=2 Tax=Haloferax TaxID=2251 RepID=A0A6G1Z3C0_9EURY|nr:MULTISPECIES: UDP-glucose 6-dehydrogenase AglM [Haloferax]KAB1188434.1 UDP-glucose/GDP-mannose dehydrogenase family protein [Haloferax sp. CBA1149]MRW81127.1 nucleotide sugar dehydrogenase [Haloferax marinisediminis]
MKLSIIGSGYVGTTVAACFAELGHDVVNVDIDEDIVRSINAGNAPIHEPGLDELVETHAGDRLRATTDYEAVLDTDATFLALPTPSNEDGSIDLGAMKAAAASLGETLAAKDDYHLVVTKSTVVPTTTAEVIGPRIEEASGKTVGDDFDIAMNPEFLREGTAVEDFLGPDKIVLGASTERAFDCLDEIFAPLVERAGNPPVVKTGTSEAEMIKYANNAFLASKISLANDLANICKEFGVDSTEVLDAIGLDSRIGSSFLGAGLGWGGSCFPKDTAAIIAAARSRGYEPRVLQAAVDVNDEQPTRMLDLLADRFDPDGKRVAVLGLSFKPGTDDIRESRAIPLIQNLVEAGADVVGYDPVATENMREHFPDIDYASSAADALVDADAALVATDWDEFAALDSEFDEMRERVVIDGRRIVTRRDGLDYESLV